MMTLGEAWRMTWVETRRFFSFKGMAIGSFFGAIWGFFSWVSNQLSSLVDAINSMAVSYDSVSCPTGQAIQFANAFFPLDDCFMYMGLLFTVFIASCTYRLIKSLIPTLS